VGVRALCGIGTLYGVANAADSATLEIINTIEGVFLVWSLFAAMALWTGQTETIHDSKFFL
jgi:hypothetical protein